MNANDMNKEIEIPFGAKDSELKGWEYTIPENMEAEIKDGKIIVKQKESEDERIRKGLIHHLKELRSWKAGTMVPIKVPAHYDAWIDYLERQKEREPLSTKETKLNSIAFLEQMGYTCIPPRKEQKPASGNSEKPNNHAEWSEEDDALLKEIVSFFRDGTVKLQHDLDLYAGFLEKKFKSLRPQPHWKPSEEQMEVDLEKFADKIKTFQGRYKYPEIVSIKGSMAFMARMFYQYPNVARQWYDSLPKTTMDDARKEV